MTLDDTKQLLLFALMDVDIPEWANWVAIDKNGMVGFYNQRPDLQMHDNCWITGAEGAGKNIRKFFSIPDGIHWADLCFEL